MCLVSVLMEIKFMFVLVNLCSVLLVMLLDIFSSVLLLVCLMVLCICFVLKLYSMMILVFVFRVLLSFFRFFILIFIGVFGCSQDVFLIVWCIELEVIIWFFLIRKVLESFRW